MATQIRKTTKAKEASEKTQVATQKKSKKSKIVIAIISLILAVVIIILGLYFGGIFEGKNLSIYKRSSGNKGYYKYYMQNELASGTYVDMTLEYRGENYTIEVYLLEKIAPITTTNFIKYVQEGFYTDTVFHRIVDNAGIFQGGGMTYTSEDGYVAKDNEREPIVGEFKNNDAKYSYNDISHVAGVISMARAGKDSATSQFFFQTKDSLGYDGDYAAFGFIVNDEDLEKLIEISASCVTGKVSGYDDAPTDEYIIKIKEAKIVKR